jgi:hypothetical protein
MAPARELGLELLDTLKMITSCVSSSGAASSVFYCLKLLLVLYYRRHLTGRRSERAGNMPVFLTACPSGFFI